MLNLLLPNSVPHSSDSIFNLWSISMFGDLAFGGRLHTLEVPCIKAAQRDGVRVFSVTEVLVTIICFQGSSSGKATLS